eukprot:TRINITY_DN13672_c0_g1_i1.p1 TRINITY_DN13672_c0_g1~~TRINITY_DN13672_c0_g1_i1.p1  ORF type:complete len:500 (+),score=73.18 TRINITY_DN13672_c0_g1_i1:58-1557(+)
MPEKKQIFYPAVWDEEGTETLTSLSERETETLVHDTMKRTSGKGVRLGYESHRTYCSKGMTELPGYVGYLDASRTWLAYWMSNAMDMIGFPVDGTKPKSHVPIPSPAHLTEFIESCFVDVDGSMGGFAGGPNQIPHLAPTYSATVMLLTLGTEEAYKVLETKKDKLLNWFLTLKNPDGSVLMHDGGEIDVRGCYCMMLPAVLLGIDTPKLREKMAEFIVSCQSYEGGFGCQPYEEAHGGYTFCATSALSLLREHQNVNKKTLSSWLAKRQCPSQGGFNGRTNKLVDACYSFWVGAAHAILKSWEAADRDDPTSVKDALLQDMIAYKNFDDFEFHPENPDHTTATDGDNDDWHDVNDKGLLNYDQVAMQTYVLRCCQAPSGGLQDKPGVGPDYYHTCYSIAGLAIAQGLNKDHHLARLGDPDSVFASSADFTDRSPVGGDKKAALIAALNSLDESASSVITTEPAMSVVRCINPVFSLRRERVVSALQYFHKTSVIPERK